jgi:tetratricopeptide (TPR) repeat protein
MTTYASSSRRPNWRRLAVGGGLGLALLYALFILMGYLWLRYALKNDRISVGEIALFRLKEIRRGMAGEQFAAGKSGWDAKNYQGAYLAFSSAVRNDPDNVAGRLMAASFLGAVGAVNLEVNLLEDGLARAPDDPRLIEHAFGLLTATGRDSHALDLMHKQYSSNLTGPNGLLLRMYEVLATLNTEGIGAAQKLLDRHPELRKSHKSAPVVARVLWESRERLAAIELLSAYIDAEPNILSAYVQLADWQTAAGMMDDARQTAERARTQFPKDLEPRILSIGLTTYDLQRGQQEIASYLKDFSDRPEAIVLLANLAGRKGWVELARTIYEVAANCQQDLRALALYYSDALLLNSRFREARQILAQVELQSEDDNSLFMAQLRPRQIEVAAALGDHDGIRDLTRRLAAAVHADPVQLEVFRRRFVQLGITDAVAELASASAAGKTAGRK